MTATLDQNTVHFTIFKLAPRLIPPGQNNVTRFLRINVLKSSDSDSNSHISVYKITKSYFTEPKLKILFYLFTFLRKKNNYCYDFSLMMVERLIFTQCDTRDISFISKCVRFIY